MKAKFLIAVFVCLSAVGCYYDKEDELYNCQVDAASTKYSTTIVAILNANGCLGCHGAGAPSGGVILSTYAGVKAVAADGRLYGSINHAAGYDPMPQGGDKINSCDIRKVKVWIDAGAPNN